MTVEEFNIKYEHYLVKGFYGLEISDKEVIKYLDKKFQEFVKILNFKYFQIKMKFGSSRFYAEGISNVLCTEVEEEINSIIKNET